MATQLAVDEADIRQRIGNLVQAIRATDLEGVKPMYAPDIGSFDFVPPLQHLGQKPNGTGGYSGWSPGHWVVASYC